MIEPTTGEAAPPKRIEAHAARPCPVVGIGASAGGLEALERLFSRLPKDTGASFVVVTHLAPHMPSLMHELLARHTAMPVKEAAVGDVPAANEVHVIPPNAVLTLEHGVLHLEPRADSHPNLIDVFLRSLAEERGEHAIGIILSGTGSDGSVGVRAIKEHDGFVLVQEPASARYDTMPRSAMTAALIDWVLPVEAMPDKLVVHLERLERGEAKLPGDRPRPGEPAPDEALVRQVCELIQRRTGHDFSRYKRTTLVRRVQRRIDMLQQRSLADYVHLLKTTPDELDRLFQDLLIGVTQFFRDPEVFAVLARDVLPKLLTDRDPDDPVRMWVPGCASGEEAYSLAILVAEALPGAAPAVKIFATDIDDEALDVARRGCYPATIAAQLTPERLDRFFTAIPDDGWRVRSSIRDMCVFSTHNIITDPPFSRMDLISCRNLLIYLESDLQQAIFPVFHYALRPGRFLLLGPSENITTRPELFTAVDAKHRIFQRKEVASPVQFPLGRARPAARRSADPPRGELSTREEALPRRIERLILGTLAPPAVVVHASGEIVFVSGQTRRFLELAPGAAGVDVCEMAAPELRPHLHVLLHEASSRRQERVHRGVTLAVGDTLERVDLVVRPLPELGADADLYAVVFRDAPPPASEELLASQRAGESDDASLVAALELELRSTRETLQTTVEDLEVANEELKSVNEELLSTNEELQSSNEELQTSKEELQSINEELQTVNAELSRKIVDLDKAHGDLQNLFASTEIATVFLGSDLTVKRFSPAATRLFRLIAGDIGRPITDIAPAFTGGDLVADVKTVLRTQRPSQQEVHGTDADIWYLQRIQPYRNAENEVVGAVLTFVDITELRAARDAARRLAAIVESSHDAILRLNAGGVIETWNRGAEDMLGYTAAEITGQRFERLLHPGARSSFAPMFAAALRGERVPPIDQTLRTRDGSPIRTLMSLSPIASAEGYELAVSFIARDITEQERNREDLHETREADRRKSEFLALLAHELRNPLAPIRNAVHLLHHQQPPGRESGRAVAMIERQIAHMARLVDDLMDVARISSGKLTVRKTHEDLAALVRAAVEDHRTEASAAGVSLEVVAAEPLWVLGDATRLTQCIGNVLGNAIKFTDPGGRVSVSAARDGDVALVEVRDNGVGMDAETAANAFEPFVQAARHVARGRGGLGLGLALVRALVELHGGTITARSDGPGRGTEVSLRLPLASRPSPTADPRPGRAGAGARRRVLVIEDNADAAESTCALLEMWGHGAATAPSGREGIEAALRDPPDVVLCDLTLGGDMDGYDVCRALRAAPATAHARIIAVTGHSLAADRQKVAEAGFDQHLIKPVDPELLQRAIDATPAEPAPAS